MYVCWPGSQHFCCNLFLPSKSMVWVWQPEEPPADQISNFPFSLHKHMLPPAAAYGKDATNEWTDWHGVGEQPKVKMYENYWWDNQHRLYFKWRKWDQDEYDEYNKRRWRVTHKQWKAMGCPVESCPTCGPLWLIPMHVRNRAAAAPAAHKRKGKGKGKGKHAQGKAKGKGRIVNALANNPRHVINRRPKRAPKGKGAKGSNGK